MKFKKAHNTLFTIFRELTNSDKYYLDGADGTILDGTHNGDRLYLCQTSLDIDGWRKGENPFQSKNPRRRQNASFASRLRMAS